MPLDPLIGGMIASSLISGGMGIAGNFFGSQDGGESPEMRNMMYNHMIRQEALQKEFAQNGITWRVQDAERAGIHPLYALGFSGAGYSPTAFVGGDAPRDRTKGMIKGLTDMGQDITRSIFSTAPQAKREAALFNLQFERGTLENELLRSQISQLKQVGPGFPSSSGMSGLLLDGQGNSSGTAAPVTEMPLRTTMTQPGRPGQDVGSIPDYAFVRTPQGYAVVPSKDAKERIEDQIVPEMMWALRNQVFPAFSGLPEPDPRYYPLPRGYDRWKWNPVRQEFRPGRRGYDRDNWRNRIIRGGR